MMKKIFVVVLLSLLHSLVLGQVPVSFQALPDNGEIIKGLTGPNIVIKSGNLTVGERSQIATFTNGFAAGLEMSKGVYFSTGIASQDLSRKNSSPGLSNEIGTYYADPDLILVDPNAIHDVVSYEFSVTLSNSATGLNIAYQFASEEFPDFVGSAYNDAFGFFIKGPGINGTANLARLPNGKTTSINTINSGIKGINGIGPYSSPLFDDSQAPNYLRNGHTIQTTITDDEVHYVENPGVQPGPFPIYIEHNAATKLINYSIRNLSPGATYNFKIIIADSSDGQLDSGVFVKDISAFMEIETQDDSYVVNQGESMTSSVFTNDKIGGLTPTSNTVVISSTDIPQGFHFNDDGTISISSTVEHGSYVFDYTVCDKTNPIFCSSSRVTVVVNQSSSCVKPAKSDGVILDTYTGISALHRGDPLHDNWPKVIKGAHTVLESKTKGFVINRLTTVQKNALTPSLGMMVYDIDLSCLSIYDGANWKCYDVQACP